MSFTAATAPISDLISTATSPAATSSRRQPTFQCHACRARFYLHPISCPYCQCTVIAERTPNPNPNPNPNPDPTANVDVLLGLIRRIAYPENDAIATVSITTSMLSSDGGTIMCAVCKDEFLVGVEAKKLPCSHLYHVDCIEPWLEENNSCPVCRSVVPSAEEAARVKCTDWGFLQEEEVRSDFREMVRRYLNYLAASSATKSPSQLAEVGGSGSEVSGPANSGETVSSGPRRRRVDEEVDSAFSRVRSRYGN